MHICYSFLSVQKCLLTIIIFFLFRLYRSDTKEDVEEVEIVENDFEFVELTPILDAEGEETNLYNMPPHERCIVHTMFLLATLDTKKAEQESLYREALRDTMSRAQQLWKMQSLNLKNAELVKEKLGQMLPEPKNNMWTSMYEALKHLQQIFKDKMEVLHEVCDAIEVQRFRDMDKIFVEEYCKVSHVVIFKLMLILMDVIFSLSKFDPMHDIKVVISVPT